MKRIAKARPKPRAPRGTGTAFYSKTRRCWVARKTVNGHRIERFGKTQGEAIRRRDEALPPGPTVTVGEWADRWLKGLRVRPSTKAIYKHTIEKRIRPSFGPVRLTELTTWHIEAEVAEWAKGDNKLSSSTITATLARLSSCLQAAVRANLIPRNPTSLVRRHRHTRAKLDLFSPDELRQIIALASTRREWYPFAACAAIGCRIGESIALDEHDYADATAELSIERTWTRAGVGPPKSERGIRTVRVPASIRALFAGAWPRCPYATILKRWGVFLKRAGLRYRNIHQLRHTVASHALAAGVSLSNVARDLGDTEETIVKTYLHPTPGADVCDAMEKLLGGGKVSPVAPIAGISGRNAAS